MNKFIINLLILSSLAMHSFAQTAASNLIVYYPFNGDANDYSGKGNHGTAFNTSLTQDRKFNNNSAFNFDGVSSYVGMPDNIFSEKQITIMAWYKLNTQPQINERKYIANVGNDSNSVYLAATPSSDSFTYKFERSGGTYNKSSGGGSTCSSSSSTDGFGQWFHFVYYVGGNESSYSDACYSNGSNFSSGYSPQAFPFDYSLGMKGFVGTSIDKTGHFNGAIDEFRIYNRQLTPDEIKAIYNETVVTGLADGGFLNSPEAFTCVADGNGKVHIKILDATLVRNTNISMYSSQGTKIEEKELADAETSLDMTYTSGMYIVSLSNNAKTVTRKFCLQ